MRRRLIMCGVVVAGLTVGAQVPWLTAAACAGMVVGYVLGAIHATRGEFEPEHTDPVPVEPITATRDGESLTITPISTSVIGGDGRTLCDVHEAGACPPGCRSAYSFDDIGEARVETDTDGTRVYHRDGRQVWP